MKKEYDFSKMKASRNPYAKLLKKQITIKINPNAVEYFKGLSTELGITYQNLINLYLIDCASKNRKLKFNWK
ncbi:MAG: antitoxin [Spirochaetes bacterium GWF1_41_5]|nr:MAG: antitoxin [Spirochaetes bacterium GWF1_41_5]HBE04386.1 antitoxin [Spirochaetia bacterium]